MRVAFFGTPPPAVKILQALIDAGHEIVCVVTQPDRPKGRGQKLSFSPVKELALKHGLPLEQPEKMKHNPVFEKLFMSLKPEIAVVAAYGKILPNELLAIPKYGFINLHASLLPKYRGAAPVQWALLNGEKEVGATIFKLVEALDAGPIILKKHLKIGDEETSETLLEKLFKIGATATIEALQLIESGIVKYTEQDETAVTYAPTLKKELGEIDWKKSAKEINNQVRALVPWPGAYTHCKGKRLKMLKTAREGISVSGKTARPGVIVEIIKGEGFVVATGQGYLTVLTVQPEGGRTMKGYDFLIGHDVKVGETLPS